MNVLLTSVGRRSYLVHYFQEALKGHGVVVATNSHTDAPGMYAADHAEVVPPSYSPDYVDTILDICKRYDIRLLCACHDLDVFMLAKKQSLFQQAGIVTMLPSSTLASICLDKYECGNLLTKEGFRVPWTSTSQELAKKALSENKIRFPLIVKARYGFGSLSLHKCNKLPELELAFQQAENDQRETIIGNFNDIEPENLVIIQESIEGPEQCISIVNDLKGNYAGHFITEIHSMRAGESDIATTLSPDTLGSLPQQLSKLIKHVGICGVDILSNNGAPTIIDINPRFSGEYPFPHLAGANVPATLCAWVEGNKPDPQWLHPTVGISGYKDINPLVIPC